MAVQSRLCRYHLFFYAPIVYRFRTLGSHPREDSSILFGGASGLVVGSSPTMHVLCF
jgi:hypothetical protein